MASRVPDPRRRFPLPRVLAPFVTERTRGKGHSYFVTGTVSILDASADFVSAHVRGTRVYHVTLNREGAGYTGTCECPFFLDRQDICKHIWAVVLAADAEGLVPADGEDAWLDVSQSRAGAGPAGAGASTPPRRMPDPWERFLDGVLQQAAAGESSRPLPRYSNGELLYVIDRALTLQGHGGAVHVQWRQRK